MTADGDPTLFCPAGQFCQLQTGVCLTKSAYWDGICAPIPDLCPTVMDEVCGCDQNTYSNECVAHSSIENVAYEGQCITESPTLAPVEQTPSPITDEPTVSLSLVTQIVMSLWQY